MQPAVGVTLIFTLFTLMKFYLPGFPRSEYRRDANFYCATMALLAFASFISQGVSKTCFGYISENITYHIRQDLYTKLLFQHIGWFDIKDNAPGVLTATLTSDT